MFFSKTIHMEKHLMAGSLAKLLVSGLKRNSFALTTSRSPMAADLVEASSKTADLQSDSIVTPALMRCLCQVGQNNYTE